MPRRTLTKSSLGQRGLVLILALWAFGLLAVFAVNIAMLVRQRTTLLSRLERREILRELAFSGVQQAWAVFWTEQENNVNQPPAYLKTSWHNNPQAFGRRPLGAGHFEVSYLENTGEPGDPRWSERSGLVDEERKLNINRADREVLKRFFEIVGQLEEEEADDLSKAVIDWREFGESEIEGFYSSDYYWNLEFPYEPTKAKFENLDELRMVQGMTDPLFARVCGELTVYGDGAVNVNTASLTVLMAVGLDRQLAGRILSVRRGPDGAEATLDDEFFDGQGSVLAKIDATPEEIDGIRELFGRGLLGTISEHFTVRSEATLPYGRSRMQAVGVFSSRENRILFWRERETTSG